MTDIDHEYPEYSVPVLGHLPNDDVKLRHYQGLALQALETTMHKLTDVELVESVQQVGTSYPLIMELSRRLERYIGLIRDEIRDQQTD